ncbi:MAG: TRAP transporter large permease subunit [Desulfobacteraceae bacterium]|nr:TRAP transporter large permease subunit [Desulfobacteraceae bacterium]
MTSSLAFIMFPALVIFLLCGYPVAFTLGGVALIFGLIGFGLDFFTLLPMRIWTRMTNFTLTAVPMFIFMGIMLERSGLAEDLLDTMSKLFGQIRGGMAISVIIVGGLLAASTGIVGATVVTMGIISLPVMLKRKYDHGLAAGTIAASGTLGQIIPPSIVLILLGDIMGVPIGSLFAGAVLPGIFLVGLYMIFVIIYGLMKPDVAPGLSKEEWVSIRGKTLFIMVAKVLLPPAFLIVAVLGSIFLGIASPTEAAAIGAIGSTILAIVKKKFNLTVLREVMQITTRLCSMAFMILLGATAFGLVFRGLGGDQIVRGFLENFVGGYWGILVVVMLMLFILGFFLDFIEITFIVLPILAPILTDIGFDMVWFSILIAVNFQTSFLTPPFGFALFFLKGVSPPEMTTVEIYKGIVPFVIIQLIGLSLIILVPKIVTWLPFVIYGY